MHNRWILPLMTALLVAACSGNEPANTQVPTTGKPEMTPQENEPEAPEKQPLPPAPTGNEQPGSPEEMVTDLIFDLKEVKELDASIRKKSGGKRSISLRIGSEPSDDQEYYGVIVAEDNGVAYATYYEFRVYPDKSIRYYDVVEDRELSLSEWRKTR